jgi:hypothetical protein
MPRLLRRTLSHTRYVGTIGLLSLAGCSLNTAQEGLAVMTIVTGNQQTVQVNAVAGPLTVRAYTADAKSIQNEPVKWAIASGGGSLSATDTLTDDTGAATVTYTAGPTAGTATITATAENVRVTFNITIVAASG